MTIRAVMKKSQLKQIIREELQKEFAASVNTGKSYKVIKNLKVFLVDKKGLAKNGQTETLRPGTSVKVLEVGQHIFVGKKPIIFKKMFSTKRYFSTWEEFSNSVSLPSAYSRFR